ncbi:hypothetical protein EHQ05_10365 [Leptospira yasudae]|uniref:hypothetical protein n=1 Tax=Leptospira yasudae TaxID=2202201 RepID=UPI0010830C5C|nr:hypothetical protein [Leptospira yasudae]TGK26170.1 hypothetical protein EHQ05_10365 [Leptospira yasudae]TGM08583.1 hypothetical protein EHQ86_03185 [Leptospira yasudae]
MEEKISDKLTVKQKKGRIICSYDRFRFSSLLGIILSLLMIGSLSIDFLKYDLSVFTLIKMLSLFIPGYILYYLTLDSFNSTNIRIDVWHIAVYDLPIPIYGRKLIRKGDVKFIKTETEDDSYGRDSKELDSVIVILNDNKRIKVIQRVDAFSDAKMVERIIRDSLKTPETSV